MEAAGPSPGGFAFFGRLKATRGKLLAMNQPDSHRPLSAGPYAQIYPGSFVVEFNLSRQQILDVNAGNRLRDALERSKAADRRKETFAGVPEDAKLFLAVRAHEQDHLRRLLSTTFGFLCDALRNQWITLASRLVADAVRTGRERIAPFELPVAARRLSFAEALADCRRLSEDGLHLESLVRGHHDLLESLVDDSTPCEFASAMWALANGSVETARSLAKGINVHRGLCAAYPMGDAKGRTLGLTARHVLEYFAIGEHANGLLRTGTDLGVVEDMVRGSGHEYATSKLAWYGVFPEREWPDVASQERHEDDLIIDWYRLFPFELSVAADLALWPPFFPNEDLSLAGELTWADVHPGRRFVKVIGAMQELGITPTVIPAKRRNEVFLDVQARICNRLGWPTPEYLAGVWSKALLRHAQARSALWPALDGPVEYRVANALRLLQARLERPADLVLNNLDFQSLGMDGIPGWAFPEPGGALAIVPMSRLEERALVPLVMIEGTRLLSTGGSYFFGNAIDPRFRAAAAGVLVELLAAAGQWDDSTRTRFGVEAKRLFRTE
jgi:hypothetical protein